MADDAAPMEEDKDDASKGLSKTSKCCAQQTRCIVRVYSSVRPHRTLQH